MKKMLTKYRIKTLLALLLLETVATAQNIEATTALIGITDYHGSGEANTPLVELVKQESEKYDKVVVLFNGDNEVKTVQFIIDKSLTGGKDLVHKRVATVDFNRRGYFTPDNPNDDYDVDGLSEDQAEHVAYEEMCQILSNAAAVKSAGVPLISPQELASKSIEELRAYFHQQIQVLGDSEKFKKQLSYYKQILQEGSAFLKLIKELRKVRNVEIVIGSGNHELALTNYTPAYLEYLSKIGGNQTHYLVTAPWTEKFKAGMQKIHTYKDGFWFDESSGIGYVHWIDSGEFNKTIGGAKRFPSYGELPNKDTSDYISTTYRIQNGDAFYIHTEEYDKLIRQKLRNLIEQAGNKLKHIVFLGHQGAKGACSKGSSSDINVDESPKYYRDGVAFSADTSAVKTIKRVLKGVELPNSVLGISSFSGHTHHACVAPIEKTINGRKVIFYTPDPYGLSAGVIAIENDGAVAKNANIHELKIDKEKMYIPAYGNRNINTSCIGKVETYNKGGIFYERVMLRDPAQFYNKLRDPKSEEYFEHWLSLSPVSDLNYDE
ncbi:MAG: hypothetical protein LBO73_04220 [Holosporaceae bacterium]|jgi:hypothetical protein|nr:hypothetical protein [Holosporaceae bacterium]